MADRPVQPHWLLRRNDQVFLAALVAMAFFGIFGWWASQGGWNTGLVEIDGAEPRTARFEVDVNTADLSELMQIPGVGSALAHRIIESRQSDGPFADTDDLLRIRGIGQKVLDRMRPYLRRTPSDPDNRTQ